MSFQEDLEEFNESLDKMFESYKNSNISGEFLSFGEYCNIYYNKLQADNILRSGD